MMFANTVILIKLQAPFNVICTLASRNSTFGIVAVSQHSQMVNGSKT